MKIILFSLFLLFFCCNPVRCQNIEGVYSREWNPVNSGVLILTLKINQDGTFTYHYHQTFTLSESEKNNAKENLVTFPAQSEHSNPEKNIYGKGTWKLDKTIVTFCTDKNTDFDDKYTLDFNKSKARFISKSPRNTSDKLVKTALKFYESEVLGVQGTAFFKIE